MLNEVAAQTDEGREQPATSAVGWQLDFENDVLGRRRTDRWFTNGIRFTRSYLRPQERLDPISSAAVNFGKAFLGASVKDSGSVYGVHWSLGQNMYTPRDISIAAPQPDDRPWAGWLYGSVSVDGTRTDSSVLWLSGDLYQQSELKVGITGRASGADSLQRWVHRQIESQYPAGWDQQLKSRLGVQIGHLRAIRFGDDVAGGPDNFGFHAGVAGQVGTLRSYGSFQLGVTVGSLRGRNPIFVISNEGDLVIQDFANREALRKWLAFATVNWTAVASNRFITGRTPYGASDIRLNRNVLAWQWGLSIPLDNSTPGWRLVYSQTTRSPEFRSNSIDRDEGVQRWGAISLQRTLR